MEQPTLCDIFGSYMAWKRDYRTWFISFMNGSEYMYLLEGDEKALLIDTGWGAGNLRPFVEKLTSKPVMVVNTHFHPDHAGGNGEWEEVWMHENWALDVPSMRDCPCDVNRLPFPDYRHQLLRDGQIIDLGNRRVEALCMTAHSNSSLMFIDHGQRLLFCGDEIEAAQVLMYAIAELPGQPYDLGARLRAHHAHCAALWQRRDEWDDLCPNHNGSPIAREYLTDFMELSEHIFAGDAKREDKLNHFYIETQSPLAPELCRVRWKGASFFVKKAELEAVWGARAL
ncbi:MAG: MBL fold metallo-hydrolase [Eubacteriales bacterium]|nr:MBL fold metallo-hydrolase [Eubacteriales bacterium]